MKTSLAHTNSRISRKTTANRNPHPRVTKRREACESRGPEVITAGNVKLRIYCGNYRQDCNGEPRTYEQYTAVYFEAGVRKRKTFSTLPAARDFAKDMAAKINENRRDVAKLDNADQSSYALAVRKLAVLGMPLHVAVEELVEARKLLPEGASLIEAVRDFAARTKNLTGMKTVPEVVAELLAVRESELTKGRASLRDVQSLRSHLNRFASFAKKPIHQVQQGDLADWLRNISEAPKTWNNLRTSLVRLFNFARERRYIPQNERTPADMVKRQKLGDTDVVTLPPGTLRTMFEGADEEARLYLALASFTGMRTAELTRLHWQHIDFAAGVIRLPKEVTKTKRKRQVPILPNLRAWLESFCGRAGKVFTSEKATDRTIAYVKAKGLDWPDNWARHSFGSYRATTTKSIGQVAMELGNSETIVKRHYFDAFASEKDALEWFAIMPPEQPANIVPMARKGAVA